MKRILMAGAAALALSLPTGAFAVDVINEDAEAHQLSVTINGAESLVDVPAGSTLKSVCEQCSLSLDGEETFDAAGDQTAMIKNGKLKIQ